MSEMKTKIEADLKSAMLARDELRTMTLRGLKSSILYEEVAQKVRDIGLTDEQIEQLIAREIKKRLEAAELFARGGNQASADKEMTEKDILSVYLPQQMSEADLMEIITSTIDEIKPEGMKDMGRVIGAVKSKTGNAADGSLIAKLVKETLQP